MTHQEKGDRPTLRNQASHNVLETIVVIVNYQGRPHLEALLHSIQENSNPGSEVLLVDNNSPDESAKIAERIIGESRVIRLDKNYGFAEACKIGARHAKSPLLVFLNNDTTVLGNWMGPLQRTLEDNLVGAVCGKVLSLDQASILNSAGGLSDLFGFVWNCGISEPDSKEYGKLGDVFYASHVCLGVRREVFEQFGGFDGENFMCLEDLDFCWRLRLAGYKILYEPASVINHKWMGTAKERPDITYLYHRNGLRTILKNYSERRLLDSAYLRVASIRTDYVGRHQKPLHGTPGHHESSGMEPSPYPVNPERPPQRSGSTQAP